MFHPLDVWPRPILSPTVVTLQETNSDVFTLVFHTCAVSRHPLPQLPGERGPSEKEGVSARLPFSFLGTVRRVRGWLTQGVICEEGRLPEGLLDASVSF